MDLLSFVDKLTPVLVVIILSYFSFKGTQNSKETDKKIQGFRLQENLKKALRRGWTTQHELEELTRLFESYVELGGNGAIKILFEKFSNLEIREEE